MSIQFDRQRLLEDDEDRKAFAAKVKIYLMKYHKASEDAATMLAKAVEAKVIEFDKAIAIAKATTGLGEMSGTGGGVGAAGANFQSGNGMEYTTKKVEEDAPMLAHGKADISTYTNDGFTKVGKRAKLKSIEPKDMWGTEPTALESATELQESRGYSQFKREAATRSKGQQMHEAAKMINKKLDEINKLLEYTNQMRGELSEGEEQLEYKHNTKALFEKMNKKVVEAYTKLKKVK
jgi:hypothetical protein